MGVVVSHGAPGPWSAPLVLPSSTGARVNTASSKTLVALALGMVAAVKSTTNITTTMIITATETPTLSQALAAPQPPMAKRNYSFCTSRRRA